MAVTGPPGRPGPHDRRPPAAVHDQASHNASAEGANELVKAPPGRCRQDRIAAGRFPQPLVSISEPASSGRCGSQPLAFAGDDQPRQFPSGSLPGVTAGRRARGWPACPACMDAHMARGWPAGGGHHREGRRPARRAPVPPGRVIHRTGDHPQATPAASPADDQVAQPGAGRIQVVNADHGKEHLARNVTGKSKSALTPAPARANHQRAGPPGCGRTEQLLVQLRRPPKPPHHRRTERRRCAVHYQGAEHVS
jgi:hypothetical protein